MERIGSVKDDRNGNRSNIQLTVPVPRLFTIQLLMTGVLICTITGCGSLVGMFVLMQGFKSIPAQFDGFNARDSRVVVVCKADVPIKLNYSNIDRELAKYMNRRFREEGIEIVNHDKVSDWLDTNGGIEDAQEVGKAFEANYVLMIDLKNYSLYEDNSPSLYRAKALALMEVYKAEDDWGMVWDVEHDSIYPIGHPIPVHEMRDSAFQRSFLLQLSRELGRYFYPHEPGEDVNAF